MSAKIISVLAMDSSARSIFTFSRGNFIGFASVRIERGVREYEDLDMELEKFMEEKFLPLLDRAHPLPNDLATDDVIVHAVSAGGLSIVKLHSHTCPEPSNFRHLEQLTRSFAYRVCRKSDKMARAITERLLP